MPAKIVKPLSQSAAEIELEGSAYYFNKASEREITFETVEYSVGTQGGETQRQRIGGQKRKPITLTKYLQAEDADLIAWAEDPHAAERTLDIKWFNDLGELLYTERLTGVKVDTIKQGEVDLDGKDLATLELELSWQSKVRV